MKIVCSTKLLMAAVNNVSRAVAVRSTVPALEGILISAKDNVVTLSGYDLEIGITTKFEAMVYQEGSVVLNAKLLLEMVKRISFNEISIAVDEKNVAIINSGITQFSIPALGGSEYPEMPLIDDDGSITVSAGNLKTMISQTIFAISTNDSKPIHTGSLIECANNTLTMVSVDGVKLALKRISIDYSEEKSFVVPGKALSEISKLITDIEAPIIIKVSDKHVLLEVEDCTVISRILEGEFLDYKSAIPQNHTTEVVVNTKDLIETIERTSLVIFDKLKAPIKLVLDENIIKFYCKSPTGNAYDELPCQIDGNLFEVGFNSRAMLDALKVITDKEIKLLFGGPLSPMKIVPVDNDDFIFLVLPVRIKNEDTTEN